MRVNVNSCSEIIHLHTGNTGHSFTKELALLSTEIYKIFLLKLFFQTNILLKSTVIDLSSNYVGFLPNILFMVVWKVNFMIISYFHFHLYVICTLVVVAVRRLQVMRFFLFGKFLCDFLHWFYEIGWKKVLIYNMQCSFPFFLLLVLVNVCVRLRVLKFLKDLDAMYDIRMSI